MSLGIESMSPADIRACTCSGNDNGNGMWGDNGLIWLIVLFLFGWGRNGYGFGGGQGGGVADNYVLATDFATIERKLDGVNNGLCDGFYAQNTNMLNGFAAVQQSICQLGNGLNQSIITNGYETRNAITDLGYNLQKCCCDINGAIQGVNYNLATQFGGLNNTLCGLGRDIMENANANYRALHEEIVANKIEAKNERIAEQQAQINALQLKASQEAQNAYLLNQLKPCPSPAYVVTAPTPVSFPTNACGTPYAGYNTGCGCNSGCGSF